MCPWKLEILMHLLPVISQKIIIALLLFKKLKENYLTKIFINIIVDKANSLLN